VNKENPKQFTVAQKFWDAFKVWGEENRVRPISRQGEDRSGW
jgi:hypothetical protein